MSVFNRVLFFLGDQVSLGGMIFLRKESEQERGERLQNPVKLPSNVPISPTLSGEGQLHQRHRKSQPGRVAGTEGTHLRAE